MADIFNQKQLSFENFNFDSLNGYNDLFSKQQGK